MMSCDRSDQTNRHLGPGEAGGPMLWTGWSRLWSHEAFSPTAASQRHKHSAELTLKGLSRWSLSAQIVVSITVSLKKKVASAHRHPP